MPNFEINPEYTETTNELNTTDPAHADLFNCIYSLLFKNDSYLKDNIEKNEKRMVAHLDNYNRHITVEERKAWNATYEQATGYADKKVADLINGAPETLDTIKEVADAIQKNETVVEALNAAIGKKLNQDDLIYKIYPVGSIYMSVNNISPDTFIGGTWEEISGRFLLGAGNGYTAGTMGGEVTHQLTASELPSHTHMIPSHTHMIPAHAHGIPSHTHTWSGTTSTKNLTGNINNVAVQSTDKGVSGSGIVSTRDVNGTSISIGTHDGITHDSNYSDSVTINASHNHTISGTTSGAAGNTNGSTAMASGGITLETASTGLGGIHNNMPPYLTVYMWRRIG